MIWQNFSAKKVLRITVLAKKKAETMIRKKVNVETQFTIRIPDLKNRIPIHLRTPLQLVNARGEILEPIDASRIPGCIFFLRRLNVNHKIQ
jgi:hypothetical protein